ncbi:MAG TPA: ArsR family transcriptional regulator [Desulfobacteraceae bacterium]|nr:ArsR family transcriptional regulator [Desulfobacteraceae bacterium]
MNQMQTIRRQIISLLSEDEMSVREISKTLAVQEKDIYEHLVHIARTVSVQKKKLITRPFQCLQCGYIFKERQRFTRPSRCPKCKKSHLQMARYRIS